MADLKPCPFCGVTPTIEQHIDFANRLRFGIECCNPKCDIQPLTCWYADEKEAIEVWNRRVEDGNECLNSL